MEIGELAGIDWDSLEFAWKPATKLTMLENTRRKIHRVKGRASCIDCEHEFHKKEFIEACPKCGSFFHLIKAGKELRIKSLIIK